MIYPIVKQIAYKLRCQYCLQIIICDWINNQATLSNISTLMLFLLNYDKIIFDSYTIRKITSRNVIIKMYSLATRLIFSLVMWFKFEKRREKSSIAFRWQTVIESHINTFCNWKSPLSKCNWNEKEILWMIMYFLLDNSCFLWTMDN